jgi:hypothetical protein
MSVQGEASTSLKIKGATLDAEASGALGIKGSVVNIN